MTDKKKFLSIQNYEEFDKRRGEFKELSMADEEIRRHAGKKFPRQKNVWKNFTELLRLISVKIVVICRGSMAAAFIPVF